MVSLAGMSPPQLPLPDLLPDLRGSDGSETEQWAGRRQEILNWMLREQYGELPPAPAAITSEILQEHHGYGADRQSIRRTLRLWLDAQRPCFLHLDLFLPDRSTPAPVLISGDGCWPYLREPVLQAALARGWIVARFNRLELAPDWGDDAGRVGVRSLGASGRSCPAIAAWAWGYHRVVDFLCMQPFVNPACLAVSGHSRGGKTVLLAGALDPRIAVTLSNNSGCGGAAPYAWRDVGSEGLADILRVFPHWFTPGLKSWLGRETELPFDQHALLACVAPRGLLLTEGAGDVWCNVGGTQRAFAAAAAVWELLGKPGAAAIYVREGGHGHLDEDWLRQIEFAAKIFAASGA